MFAGLQGWHLLIILAVILLLFGAPKLPQLARSVGQSMRIFKSEVKTMKDEDGTERRESTEGTTGTVAGSTGSTTGTGTTTPPESPLK
ncbi:MULTISPECIES: Sec-independent protein translocase subunit TatA [unclassified Rathayibacter]|uniref:Sec-independent protein translocase subunit TatA n=1 Tax=unclassified Rathayibacter TaxID=2609250 RepID=UPI000CE75AD8|nr:MULTISPECIES: Sec-independent protein translocase subunit TatA [unclassified Rathayibacter]PPF37751.1 twin-arginine translocase TatA/TatE family subunit [Rathayibacter sp. AY1A3]PPF59674.1 twin-arginine translocase TatA/TatE family subunit [Rathayibacter sp. AY1C2]PPG62181.1 twin-arginine translocase TatA/TatE family subunit [Rathayibacter sp. AY1C7]PPH55532.1 twin-arginine translocase TatA/TatE family subunit [Rathayibacter sp. AY1E1]PPH92895.1 twin-arginine translocase TatA/TatE family su